MVKALFYRQDKLSLFKFVEMKAKVYIMTIIFLLMVTQCKLFFSLFNSVEKQGCC